MKKEKLKHMILIVIAITLIGIGYLNYDYENTLEVASIDNAVDESNIGDAQLVNANVTQEAIVPNEESEIAVTNSETQENQDEYFSKTKLDRETMYSQMLETYQKMVDSKEITNDQKSIAIQEINNITNQKNAIMIAENLIKNKGFEEVVILISNNNASVIVKSNNLTQEQIAQIQNIISRELNLKFENINITQK